MIIDENVLRIEKLAYLDMLRPSERSDPLISCGAVRKTNALCIFGPRAPLKAGQVDNLSHGALVVIVIDHRYRGGPLPPPPGPQCSILRPLAKAIGQHDCPHDPVCRHPHCLYHHCKAPYHANPLAGGGALCGGWLALIT